MTKAETAFAEGALQRLQAENDRLRRALAARDEALRQIAEHKFLSYEAAERGIYEGQYGIGVVDGHRACANIARSAMGKGVV